MATLIETSDAPYGRVEVEPVTVDIIENALRNARYEMDAVLFRTAMSPGIREQHDEFPLIADQQGRMVVGQFGLSVPDFLAGFDGTVEEGDVLMTSDPYACGGAISHANDWLVVLPIFYEGHIVGWSAMFGHMTDVGGKVPGSLPTDATSIFEEGVRVPPFKLYKHGELNTEMLTLILNQVRMKDWNRSDLNAIVAACRTAARRITELCARFGPETYLSCLDALLNRNYQAMKQLIATTIPATETLTFTDYLCDDGMGFGPYKIHCSMYREGDGVVLDFTGTDPQSPGSINYYLNENLYKMFFGIYMIMVFDPQILWNDGYYPLVDVRIPEGTLLKPTYPAALSCRTHALGRIFDILGGLLGQRQLLVVPAPDVLGQPRGHRRVVPALPDWVRRHPRPAVRRRAGRALAVALVHQRAQRVPGSVLPVGHRGVPDRARLWRARVFPRRQRGRHRIPVPGDRKHIHPRRPLVRPAVGRQRRPARSAQSEMAGTGRRQH
jgi:N-methylhydantoinase B